MSSSTLLTLPRELRDMVLQYVMDSPQPELEFDQLVYLSTTFIVSSAQTVAPANMLSTCRQLREETLSLMNFRDRTPKLEVHIKDMSTGWEVCTAWRVPPSACTYSRNRKHKVDSMTVDLKPRNITAYTKPACSDLLQYYPTCRSLWRDNLLSESVAGDFFGYIVSGAVQRLGLFNGPADVWKANTPPPADGIPQLRHVSRIRNNPHIILRSLCLNICQDERYPDEPLPDIVVRGIRGDALTFMYRCVASSVSCCPGAVRMVDQEDGFKQLMCYCDHRAMWYTQVGSITIAEGSALHHRINLGNMLSNDIKTTRDSASVSYLQNLMSLRERRGLDYVHRAGIQRGFTRYRPDLPASMYSATCISTSEIDSPSHILLDIFYIPACDSALEETKANGAQTAEKRPRKAMNSHEVPIFSL